MSYYGLYKKKKDSDVFDYLHNYYLGSYEGQLVEDEGKYILSFDKRVPTVRYESYLKDGGLVPIVIPVIELKGVYSIEDREAETILTVTLDALFLQDDKSVFVFKPL